MDKTEARAIIKCLQKKDLKPEDTSALNCYRTLLIHQNQPSPTFVYFLNSDHTFLVATLETIRFVEDCLVDQGATVFREGIAMHGHHWTKCIDVKEDSILKSTIEEFDPRLRRTFYPAYFRLSPLHKHVKKVVGGFGKKSCVSTGVRKPGNTCASPTAMIWP